jgi:hypothetical protein
MADLADIAAVTTELTGGRQSGVTYGGFGQGSSQAKRGGAGSG